MISCRHSSDEIQPCQITEAKYYRDIQPILKNNCATSGCHNSSTGLGNFNNYDELNEVCNNGKFQKRVLWNRDMPPFKLDTCDFLKIRKWFNSGHQKN